MLLPGLAYGSSDHWLPLGATLSLRPATLIAVLADVLRSLCDAGFGRCIVVNGHAGNAGPIATVAGDTAIAGILVETVSYWTLVDPTRLAGACAVDRGGIGHAGEVETSIAMALDGHGLLRAGVALVPGFPLTPDGPGGTGVGLARAPRPLEEAPTGVYGDPTAASAELGSLVLDEAATALAGYLA